MKRATDCGFPFFTFDHFSDCPGLRHFVSSVDDRERSNLGFVEWADPLQVIENRQRLAAAVGFPLQKLTIGQQTHSCNIAVVREKEAGSGASDNALRIPSTDALITNVKGVCLMVMTADCVPVLLYDPVKHAVAAIHAGWRGTVGGIVGQTLALMEKEYGTVPADVIAGIGPSIGKCCFEVGGEVAEAFTDRYGRIPALVEAGAREGKYQVDLWEANRLQLIMCGVPEKHIETAGVCTFCSHNEFFSYRYDKGDTGRLGSGVMLV